jgi:hypothetical protein
MRINQGYLGWGVFLILVGAIPLAVNAGLVPAETVDAWWSLWPLILIGIGLGIILGRTSLSWLGGLVIAATFGLMVGSLAATGIGGIPFTGCGSGGNGTPFASREGAFAERADVQIDFNCGDLTVTSLAGTGWRLEGSDDTGVGPDVTSDATSLHIAPRDRTFGFGIATGDSWVVHLPTEVRLDLDLGLNAGSGDIELAATTLDRVDVEMNAGDIRLDLGAAATLAGLDVGINAGAIGITLPATSVTGAIEANAGSVEICVPEGVGLRLRTSENLTASYDYGDAGLIQVGNTWTTPGYETATAQIDLATSGNAASFSLNPEDGCDG